MNNTMYTVTLSSCPDSSVCIEILSATVEYVTPFHYHDYILFYSVDSLRPSQQYIKHIRMISCLHWLNQYYPEDNVLFKVII